MSLFGNPSTATEEADVKEEKESFVTQIFGEWKAAGGGIKGWIYDHSVGWIKNMVANVVGFFTGDKPGETTETGDVETEKKGFWDSIWGNWKGGGGGIRGWIYDHSVGWIKGLVGKVVGFFSGKDTEGGTTSGDAKATGDVDTEKTGFWGKIWGKWEGGGGGIRGWIYDHSVGWIKGLVGKVVSFFSGKDEEGASTSGDAKATGDVEVEQTGFLSQIWGEWSGGGGGIRGWIYDHSVGWIKGLVSKVVGFFSGTDEEGESTSGDQVATDAVSEEKKSFVSSIIGSFGPPPAVGILGWVWKNSVGRIKGIIDSVKSLFGFGASGGESDEDYAKRLKDYNEELYALQSEYMHRGGGMYGMDYGQALAQAKSDLGSAPVQRKGKEVGGSESADIDTEKGNFLTDIVGGFNSEGNGILGWAWEQTVGRFIDMKNKILDLLAGWGFIKLEDDEGISTSFEIDIKGGIQKVWDNVVGKYNSLIDNIAGFSFSIPEWSVTVGGWWNTPSKTFSIGPFGPYTPFSFVSAARISPGSFGTSSSMGQSSSVDASGGSTSGPFDYIEQGVNAAQNQAVATVPAQVSSSFIGPLVPGQQRLDPGETPGAGVIPVQAALTQPQTVPWDFIGPLMPHQTRAPQPAPKPKPYVPNYGFSSNWWDSISYDRGYGDFDGDEWQTGGKVPGVRGAPVPAMLHGGETVLPTHLDKGWLTSTKGGQLLGGMGGGGVGTVNMMNKPTTINIYTTENAVQAIENVERMQMMDEASFFTAV